MAVNNVTTSNVRWYDGNADGDGCGLGAKTTSLIGFYATAPITRRASADMAQFTVTFTASNGFGFVTSADMNAFTAVVEEMRATLVALGLHSGAA